jgi:hypothetical protein
MAVVVDLETLKTEIDGIGAKIKELKTSGGSKEDIGAAVKELLDKKTAYADNNGGIGVDGKPFKAAMSKSEKKKQAKAEKGGAGGAGAADAKPVSNTQGMELIQPQ